MHGNFSPDGRLIACTSNESGRFQVNVQTLPASDNKWPVSTDGGYEPRWRADGREIYYLSEDRKLMAAAVGPGAQALAEVALELPKYQDPYRPSYWVSGWLSYAHRRRFDGIGSSHEPEFESAAEVTLPGMRSAWAHILYEDDVQRMLVLCATAAS